MPADFNDASHRPWQMPAGRHAMEMIWHDLLFAHWPVPVQALRRLIPGLLAIDTFDGEAWLGVVPFRMSGVRPAFLPGLPGASQFPEINVRTYVTEGGKPGVYFFSLDAASLLAVAGGRAWYHLPYYHARMRCRAGDGMIDYGSSRRVRKGQATADFQASYGPLGDASCGECGPLANWLTERYCLYSNSRATVFRAEVHHAMWPLHRAQAEISQNTMTVPLGIALPDTPPLLHFAKRLEVAAWNPQRII